MEIMSGKLFISGTVWAFYRLLLALYYPALSIFLVIKSLQICFHLNFNLLVSLTIIYASHRQCNMGKSAAKSWGVGKL